MREKKNRARGWCAGKHTCNTKQNLQGRYRSISRHTQPRGRHPQPVPINLEAHTVMVTSSHRVDGTTLESKSPTAKAEPINLKAHSPRVPQADLGWRRNTERSLACKCLADNINTRRAGNKSSVYTGRRSFHLVTIHAPCGKERIVHGA